MTTLDWKAIREASAVIARGGLVAMPTETVYGLAADATNDEAVARIFEAKGRPQFNPLIVHVADVEMAARYVTTPPLAKMLADAFWPGPLTVVLARRPDSSVSLLASAGLDTLGVRAPDHKLAQALIKTADRPLAAPSANRSGAISPTRADHVAASLGDAVDAMLDGGACPVGVESTIVKVEGDTVFLLRPGGLARDDLERVIGKRLAEPPQTITPESPGRLASHYAPRAKLRLNVEKPRASEAYLAFGAAAPTHPHARNLSPAGDLREAAANLFAYLRDLDDICAAHNLDGVAAAPIPRRGLGEAINDRLARAAAPR